MAAELSERAFDALVRIASCDPATVAWRCDRDLTVVAQSASERAGVDDAGQPMTLARLFQMGSSDAEIVRAHDQALDGKSRLVNFFWHGEHYRAHVSPDYDAEGHIQGVLGLAFPQPQQWAPGRASSPATILGST